MDTSLVEQILEHPNPNRVIDAVKRELEKEQEARRRFREWLKPDVKAEFINGEIILHSPALRRHNNATNRINILLSVYATAHKLGEVAVEKAMVGLERSDLEPDCSFWSYNQVITMNEETLIYPAPNLVIEVLSKSTQGRDRGVKFHAYEQAEIDEYWIVDSKKRTVEQYVFSISDNSRQFELRAKLSGSDKIHCEAVTGFSTSISAFFDEAAFAKALTKISALLPEEE